MDKRCTEQLKGLAIILVILNHFSITKFAYIPLGQFLGSWGVAVFLLLSGYGLTKSYLHNGIDTGFFKKRIYKVLLPYSLVTLVWIIVDAVFLNKHYPWRVILSGLVGFDLTRSIDPSMWYITFILLWYVCFYLLFKLPVPNVVKLAGLFAIAYIFYFHSASSLTRHMVGQWRLNSASFPIGVLFGLYLPRFNKKLNLLVAAVSFYACYKEVRLHEAFGYTGAPYAHFLSCIFFAIGVMFLFMVLGDLKPMSVFSAIGSISYELYLVEFAFLSKYNVLQIPNKLLALVLYVGIITGLSLLLKREVNHSHSLLLPHQS